MPPWLASGFEWEVLVLTIVYYVWTDVIAHRPDTSRSVGRAALEAIGTFRDSSEH